MAEIQLVRQPARQVTEAEKEAALRVLFGAIDGLGERGKRQWRRFMRGLLKMEPGEITEIRTHKERLGWYHKKHMKLESRVFEEQERFDHFRAFRAWLKVGAGHVDWYPGPKGGVVPVPKSIAYSEMEQQEMEEFHAAAVQFLRQPHALKVLWPKAPQAHRELAIEALLAEFNE